MSVQASPARGITSAFGRAFEAVAANPGLLAPPFAVALAGLVTVVATAVALVAPFGLALLASIRDLARLRPDAVLESLESALRHLAARPLVLLPAVLVALVLGTLVVLLASFVKAGTVGVLLAADEGAGSGAGLEGFRVEAARDRFFQTAGRFTWRVFWLLNLYGLVVLVAAMAPLLLLLGFTLTASRSHPAAPVLLLLFVVTLPVVLAISIASQLATAAATRQLVKHDLPLLEAVGQGLARLRRTAVRSCGLLLLLVAAGATVGVVFTLPRVLASVLLQRLLRDGTPAMLASEIVFGIAQTLVSMAFSVVSTAAFVSLWHEGSPGETPRDEAPPVAFDARRLPEAPARGDEDPFPEAALPFPMSTGGSIP